MADLSSWPRTARFPVMKPKITVDMARAIAGAGAFFLTILVFGMIYIKPELAKDDLFKSLAQAVVMQGLIGLAMAFLFTGRNSPPKDPE